MSYRRLSVCRPKTASPEAVMSDQPDGIAVVNQGIIAGDFLVDGDQHFFFANQLQQVTQLHALALNHLPDRHGRRDFAREIAFAVGRLELSHQGNRHHLLRKPPFNAVDSVREAQR